MVSPVDKNEATPVVSNPEPKKRKTVRKIEKRGRKKQPVYKITSAVVKNVKLKHQEWDGGKVMIAVTFADNDKDCLASFSIPNTKPQTWWHISTTMARLKSATLPKEKRNIIKQRDKIMRDIGMCNAFRLAFPKFTYRTTNTLRTLAGYDLEKYNELRKKRWMKLLKELSTKYVLFRSEKEYQTAIDSIHQPLYNVAIPEYIKEQIELCKQTKKES